MALETVVFPQDTLTNYTTSCSKEYNLFSNNLCMNNYHEFGNYSSMLLEDDNKLTFNNDVGIFDNVNDYDFSNSNTPQNSEILLDNATQWDHHHQQQQQQQQQQQYVYCEYSSQEEYREAPPSAIAATANTAGSGARRKRRRRSGKNTEEVEQQRMTHIAVERNRRKQMNEYLAVIRSLMPPSYVQRGDQASIVGGAINYVKELEQMLQSLEVEKRNKIPQEEHEQILSSHKCGETSNDGVRIEDSRSGINDEVTTLETTPQKPVFTEFFSFPQYSTLSPGSDSVSSDTIAAGEIEVTMADSHASVKILAKKQPKQLLKLVASFQSLRLNILHLNVTTVDSFVLYSLSLKVEEGCQLNSVDDIAAAANHILTQIQQEAAALL